MSSESNNKSGDQRKGKAGSAAPPFSEAGAWRDVGAGWQPIFGSFRSVGYSIEWNDFKARRSSCRGHSVLISEARDWRQAPWADYDNDGHLDLFAASTGAFGGRPSCS